jgi:hypothetical protein
MAKISSQVVQELVGEVDALVEKINKSGADAREKLGDLNVGATTGALPRSAGQFDPAGWDNLSEQAQGGYLDRLELVRDALHKILGQDGPADPRHIMHWDYAANSWIIICAALGVVLVLGLLAGIILRWDAATSGSWAPTTGRASEVLRQAIDDKSIALSREIAAAGAVEDLRGKAGREADLETADGALTAAKTGADEAQQRVIQAQEAADKAMEAAKQYGNLSGPTEGAILYMVVLWGALGGSLHLLRSLAAFVGNRQLVRSWILHYFSLPFIGAALAAVVYLLLRVGLVSPTGTTSDGSAIANLNVMAIYGFAALTGLFAKAASDKLAELFGTLFRTTAPPQKDALASGKDGQ